MGAASGKPDSSAVRMSLAAEMRPALIRYFKRKSGSAVEAEDLAQEVLAQSLKHELKESADHLKGYIFRAAINHWKDRLRKKLTRGATLPLDAEESELPPDSITPERVAMAEQELGQVVKALLELDANARHVFALVRIEQMKATTVAQMLGLSRSAVNRLLAKAIAHIYAQAAERK